MASAGKILIIPKGEYDSNASYKILDLVSKTGSLWLAKKDVTGIEPSTENSEYWFEFGNFETLIDSKIKAQDNGWNDANLLSPFTPLSPLAKLRYRKIGNIVYLRGTISTLETIASGQITQICTLPEGFRPKDASVSGIMCSNTMNNWRLLIDTNGIAYCSKYGTTTDNVIPANEVLNIDFSFIAD